MKLTTAAILAFIIGMGITSCKKEEMEEPMAELKTATYEYDFHNGQTVPAAPYDGVHSSDLSASIKLDELESGKTQVTVTIMNTIDGETYHVHAHDAADASTTPNGTPYNETPNTDVFTQMKAGNGGSIILTQESTMSFADLTDTYEGFFVIHDPLQAINTQDISTYLIVGSFARAQTKTDYKQMSFNYDFNTGQVDPSYAYSGSHASNLMANIMVEELADSKSRVTVSLMNSLTGETYNVHSHDMADASTTPNGTPYIESPNAEVCVMQMSGNGGTVWNSQISSMSYSELTTSYDGFFVVHDPLQAMTTVDPTTYVLLGVFAR